MTIFRAPILMEWPLNIRVLTILISTVAFLVAPAHATEEPTPPADLMQMQKELVATLGVRLDRLKAEHRVGQRTELEITLAMEDYYRELETACAMEAQATATKTATQTQILQARIDAVSKASEVFDAYTASSQNRYEVGEITEADTAAGKAMALKTRIRLATLKKQLPAKAAKRARSCEMAALP